MWAIYADVEQAKWMEKFDIERIVIMWCMLALPPGGFDLAGGVMPYMKYLW